MPLIGLVLIKRKIENSGRVKKNPSIHNIYNENNTGEEIHLGLPVNTHSILKI